MEARSLPHAVYLHALSRPLCPAVRVWSAKEAEYRTLSYGELWAHVRTARTRVRALLGRAACTGQRIAILSHNSPAYLVHSLACMSLGAIAVHLNWRQSAATLGEQLSDLDCAVLLVSSSLEVAGRQAAAVAPQCVLEPLGELAPLDAAEPPAAAGDDDDEAAADGAAVVFFTSGSTGKPKAIPHTHATLLWWARSYTAHLPAIFDRHTPREAWGSLSFAPYFHVMGFVANTVRARHSARHAFGRRGGLPRTPTPRPCCPLRRIMTALGAIAGSASHTTLPITRSHDLQRSPTISHDLP